MNNKTVSIAQSCLPSQMSTRKSVVNPKEFSPMDWQFNPAGDITGYDWRPGNAIQSNDNFFSQREPYQNIKNSMFNPLTGQEGIYGHVKFMLNPLQQEQTNAHMSGYQLQKQTRVADNMSPLYVMRNPTYNYPVNTRPGIWQNIYTGSMGR